MIPSPSHPPEMPAEPEHTELLTSNVATGDVLEIVTAGGKHSIVQITNYHGGALLFSATNSEGQELLLALEESGEAHEIKK